MHFSFVGRQPDILQVAALYDQGSLERHFFPTGPVSSHALNVNQISFQGKEMFHNGIQCFPVCVKQGLQDFLQFLPENTVLVAHNSFAFDMRILLLHILDCGFIDLFKAKVLGFVDSLPVAKEACPKKASHSLESLAEGCDFEHHNATGDTKALQFIVRNLNPSNKLLEKHPLSTTSAVALLEYKIRSDARLCSFDSMIAAKAISKGMAQRAADSGLCKEHFDFIYTKDKDQGIKSLLSEEGPLKKPRVSNSTSVYQKLLKYYSNTANEIC